MTVPSRYPKYVVQGDSTRSTYPLTVTARRQEDLFVEVVHGLSGVRTKLTLGTDYTLREVSGIWSLSFLSVSRDYLFGNTANLSSAYRLEVRRVVVIEQETSIRNQGEFYADLHEDVFDNLTEQNQQQQYDLDSSIKLVDIDGNAQGGTLTAKRDSLIAIGSDGNLELIAHDEEVITGEKVDALEDAVGGRDDDRDEDTAFGRIKRNTEDIATADDSIDELVEDLGERPDGDPPAFTQLGSLMTAIGQGISVFTIRLYYTTDTEVPLVNFPVKPVGAFSIAPSLFGTGALQYQQETNRDPASPSEVFTYEGINELRGRLSSGKHIQGIDVEFHAHKITEDNYATHNLPQSFVGGIRGIPFTWSPVSIRVTDQDFHGGGGPSVTFIRETVVEPAINIHNQDEGAHPAIQTRLTALEGRSPGGGSSTRGLRVVAVNDGLPVFDTKEAIPDSITLTVQTDTSIHAPVTVRLRGQETQAGIAVVIGTRGDTAISPGVVERVTFQLTSAQKDLIESVAQGRNGTADISIYGASASGGSATRQATFAIYIKNSLASMIGPVNRNEILVNGLPGLIPNIIQTVLANMTKTHTPITLLGGVGSASVPTGTVIAERVFEEFKKAEYLYLYTRGSHSGRVTQAQLYEDATSKYVLPLAGLNRVTGDLGRMRQWRGNNDTVFSISGTRRIIATGNFSGVAQNRILWAVAYVPTFSFTPTRGASIPGYTAP